MADSKYKKKFSTDETAVFCDQIAIILNGGITIPEGIHMLYSEMEDKKTKAVLKEIDDKVKDNIQLYTALKETEAFPEYMLDMVRVGEVTGKLEEVMESLSKYYERESSIKAGIKSIISYPIILFAMIAVILFVLVAKILPMFQEVLDELNYNMSGNTQSIMDFGMNAGVVVAITAGAVFLISGFLVLWNRTKFGKKIINNVASCIPVSGKILKKINMGKFISSMSLMVSSGIDTEEALELSKKLVSQKEMEEKIQNCIELVQKGSALDESFKETGLVKGMDGRMISVGMRTGVLDTVLAKLSKSYDEQIENSLSSVSVLIEAILVVLLSVMVGAILISVMFPLVSIISSIG